MSLPICTICSREFGEGHICTPSLKSNLELLARDLLESQLRRVARRRLIAERARLFDLENEFDA